MPGLGYCAAARCGNTAFPIASGCLRDNVRLRDVPTRDLQEYGRLQGTRAHKLPRYPMPQTHAVNRKTPSCRVRSEADVTECSGGIWERLYYDWSDPNHVVLT